MQKERNAAAALSREKFELFKKKAEGFLKKPSKQFFEIKEFDVKNLSEKYKDKKLILLEVAPLKRKEDIAGAKLVKALDFFKKRLAENDFNILESGMDWGRKGNAHLYFIFSNKLLPESKEIIGPPLKIKFHVKNFKSRYKKTKAKNGRIYAVVKRKFRMPENLLKNLIKDAYVKDKVIGIKILG